MICVPPLGKLAQRVGAVADALPLAPTLRSTIRLGRSASTTSMSTVSVVPAALTCTRALDPTPRSGPEYSQ